MDEFYRHKKSGRYYTVHSENHINATNAQDGQRMVCYSGEKKDGSGLGLFVREYHEFHEKFEPIDIKLKTINDILVEKFGVTETNPDYTLKDDLGLDSLDVVEFIMECETEFQIRISDEDGELFDGFTIEEVLECINKYLK